MAASAAKEGALACDLDAVARDVTVGKGLGKWVPRRLGHGTWGVIYRNYDPSWY